MKWPRYLMLIRHDRSAYNVMKERKRNNPIYQEFVAACKANPQSKGTIELAQKALEICKVRAGDYDTPIAEGEGHQAETTGRELEKNFELPDVIFVSPYVRTIQTLNLIIKGWPALRNVKVIKEERIREQEHGLVLLYNDLKLFDFFHPEQKLLRKQEGSYWYRYPQGENVPDVRLRNHSWIGTLIRDYAGEKVMVITHHLNILATRANFERLASENFSHMDENEKPINCGVTLYKGNPKLGRNGKLELVFYNKKYY